MTGNRRDRYRPRDGPIRWDRVAARLGYQALAIASVAAHLVLAAWLVAALRAQPVDWLLALAWIGLALFAAWSWWFHRWRIVAAPLVIAVLVVLAGRVP